MLLVLIVSQMSVEAQSYVLGSGNIDLGILQPANFQNNVLSNRTSYSTALGFGLEYRFRNVFAIETGIAQNADRLRLQDHTFEETYTSHSLNYNQRSTYLNYYGALQVFIPVANNAWVYTKCAYSLPIDRAETVIESYDYEILKADVEHTILASATFSNRKQSIIPEIGYQTKLNNGAFLSFGIKMDFSQRDLINGTYELFDRRTQESVRSESFSSNGNSFSFQTKLSFPLHEFVKRERSKPKDEPDLIEEKEEEIIVAEKEEKETVVKLKGKDDANIVRDKKGTPTLLNNREILKTKTIHVSSDTITIKVWDNGKQIDGDSISLNLNGEWILQGYRLKGKKLVMRIPIERKSDNFLILYALNLGTAPPNTAAVLVYDGKQQKLLRLVSDLETCGAINIINK